MSDLKEIRDKILLMPSPEKFLLLADKYLQRMEEMGEDFRLPREHAAVRPILETYDKDLRGWIRFVDGIRLQLPSRSASRLAVQQVYRVLDTRLTQRERRVRLNAAVAKALEKGLLENDYAAKQAYALKCTRLWVRRKETLLASHRAAKKMLSATERKDVLDELWAHIDAEIANGEVPKP